MSIKQRWEKLMTNQPLKHKLYEIIFGSDTPMGKSFDILLMVCIVVSIVITIFDSLFTNPWITGSLVGLEIVLNLFFTFEYLARLYCSPRPKDYAFSFFGIVDLISISPMYLAWLLPGARFVIVLRSIRLIRVFRIFKLFSFLDEGYKLMESLKQSFKKIFVFFLFVLILVICLGTVMYMVEGGEPDSQFTDIPTSIYWAIVTMTTVGYGDITPITPLGRFFAGIVMLLGYTIIAVPTGIVSSEMVKQAQTPEEKYSKDTLNGEVDETEEGDNSDKSE